jgi:hypothetical protein
MRLLRSRAALAVSIACAHALSACAGVRVYSDPALTRETGVKVFAPKPYLLVARTGAKTTPVQLSIVYLPDTSDISYIRQQRGWGSNDLGIGIQNGMLVQFGSKSDARVGDGAGAIADLLRAATAAYADVRPRVGPDVADQDQEPFELYEIRQDLGRTRLVRVTIAAEPQRNRAPR